MQEFKILSKNKHIILALGAESAGNFSIFISGKIYFSKDFGNLLDEKNYKKFKSELLSFLKKNSIEPTVIICDLHPLFQTTQLAQKLARKYKAKFIPVQHHIAHIFSAIGDEMIMSKKFELEKKFLGIACDGTGYAEDETIWGGEIIKISEYECQISNKIPNQKLQIDRIGHLENQILIGGEKAIEEPARMLISILSKFLSKQKTYSYVKKYYTKNEFELLWNQLQQNFNCLETSSTARILDAVSILLEFSKNERLSKHGPVTLLEPNSTKPLKNLKPKIEHRAIGHQSLATLNTTFLFEYLIKNLNLDKKRLAATAQKYIADGLVEIINLSFANCQFSPKVFFAGGMANNKIISKTLESNGVYINKKIPRGDAGISFGQIIYLLANSRD